MAGFAEQVTTFMRHHFLPTCQVFCFASWDVAGIRKRLARQRSGDAIVMYCTGKMPPAELSSVFAALPKRAFLTLLLNRTGIGSRLNPTVKLLASVCDVACFESRSGPLLHHVHRELSNSRYRITLRDCFSNMRRNGLKDVNLLVGPGIDSESHFLCLSDLPVVVG